MNVKAIIFAAGLFLSAAQTMAASCYSYDKKGISIKWTAFKTPRRIGVTGSLPNYSISGKMKGASVAELLKGQKIDIRVNQVASGNAGRDVKIVKFFFSGLVGGDIMTAKVKDVTKKIITMELILNGKKNVIPLMYKMNGMKLTATGHMDLFDFGMIDQLHALNKACYAMHEGKTWSQVVLSLETTLTSCK